MKNFGASSKKRHNKSFDRETRDIDINVNKFDLNEESGEISVPQPPPVQAEKKDSFDNSVITQRGSIKFASLKGSIKYGSQRFFRKKGKKKKSEVHSQKSNNTSYYSKNYSTTSKTDLGIDDIEVFPTGKEAGLLGEVAICEIDDEDERDTYIQRENSMAILRQNSEGNLLAATLQKLRPQSGKGLLEEEVSEEVKFLSEANKTN